MYGDVGGCHHVTTKDAIQLEQTSKLAPHTLAQGLLVAGHDAV